MRKEDVIFAELIAIGTGLKKKSEIVFNEVDLAYIMELGKKHSLQAILYKALKSYGALELCDLSLVDKYKKDIFMINFLQKRNETGAVGIFKDLIAGSINFLALKGILLKKYYPLPELRTMCDIDILVKKEDVESAGNILVQSGYRKCHGEAPHHIQYEKSGYPTVEVHWNIVKSVVLQDEMEEFQKSIWERTQYTDFHNLNIKTLGMEDFLLQLLMHMAAHITGGGFGIRQLIDLNLFVKNNLYTINWSMAEEQCRKTGFYDFACAVFQVSKELFDIKVPIEFEHKKNKNKKYIYNLKKEIINAGVYGKRDIASSMGNQLAYNYSGKDKSSVSGVAGRFIKFIFPSVSKLSDKYSYAQKYRILLPVAWIHHFFSGVFIKEYSIKEKLTFLFKAPLVSLRKNRLLKWLKI